MSAREQMKALDRAEYRAVETTSPEAGCKGCAFRAEEHCPNEYDVPGWDCTAQGANVVFVKRASFTGAALRLVA